MALTAQTLQGIVSDAATHKPIFPATVVNVRTREVAYTNTNGYYSITAQQGDVIAFTCIGYKNEERTKPPSVLIANLNVAMEQQEYELKTVVLGPGALTKYQVDSIERAQVYKIPLQRRPPSPIMSPVSAIAEKFSKKAKRTYQFQEDFANAELQKFIDTRYTPDVVTSVTGLTGDSIGYFMYAYPMPYEFARNATGLEIKMWVRDNYKQWMRKLSPEVHK
ncbi:hypothetical protein GCM10023093_00650 [Nemorincola caseinilytica]|uniref:Carboxypeptidase-like regulatory domain-containing protein n=1 Tax=Nemorincola caseinilytica TaxID=2054315 RepID=A0ABP8N178_9BACT